MYALISMIAILASIEAILRVPRLAKAFPPAQARISSIDGLRGFLAMGVVFAHFLAYRTYFRDGVWAYPSQHFFRSSAEGAVAMFFCITGFLFWEKAIRSHGKMNIADLYKRRFLRIYPLYAVCALLTIGFCLITRNVVRALPGDSFRTAAELSIPGCGLWCPLGGSNTGLLLTQAWSLAYEFGFYLVLPFLAVFAKSLRIFIIFAVVAALGIYAETKFVTASSWLTDNVHFLLLNPFLAGMICAEIKQKADWSGWLKSAPGSALLIAGFLVLYLLPTVNVRYGLPVFVACFLPISHGNDFFGLLTTRCCRALGDISFSVYMSHMFVLFIVIANLNSTIHPWALSDLQYWSVGLGCFLGIVLVSLVSYKLFEEPFVRGSFGKSARASGV